jgi:hypothetical protein
MGQGGAHEGEDPENYNHRKGNAQEEALWNLVQVEFLFKDRNDSEDGQDEVNGVVVEEFACDFGSESAEVELVSANTSSMETEAYKVILEIPFQDGQDQIDGYEQGAIECPGFERFPVENEDVKHQSDPKKRT